MSPSSRPWTGAPRLPALPNARERGLSTRATPGGRGGTGALSDSASLRDTQHQPSRRSNCGPGLHCHTSVGSRRPPLPTRLASPALRSAKAAARWGRAFAFPDRSGDESREEGHPVLAGSVRCEGARAPLGGVLLRSQVGRGSRTTPFAAPSGELPGQAVRCRREASPSGDSM